ncbi:hypothetical protein JCM3775_004915 [Rhodotorula graminis]
MATTRPEPSQDELAALLECCRYGDLDQGDFDDIKQFAHQYGDHWLANAKDDRDNTPLHMAAGNGHTEIVSWLLPRLPLAALSAQNTALSTPLHWACLNYHLAVLELLCPLLPLAAFDLKNHHGKTAVQEAEEACEALVVGEDDQDTPLGKERVRREKCVGYVLGCMGLGVKAPTGGDDAKAEEAPSDDKAGEVAGADDETVKRLAEQADKLKLEQEQQQQQSQA